MPSSSAPPIAKTNGHNGNRELTRSGATHHAHRDIPRNGTFRPWEAARGNVECVRIVIAGDQPIFRDGLHKLIETQKGMRVMGECPITPGVVQLARNLKPDVVLLDLGLPGRSGLQVLRDLAQLSPSVRTLVLATAAEESAILEAFYLGARGVVLKGSPRQVLVESIRSVTQGEYWLEGEIVPILIEALRKSPPPQNGALCERDYGLTPQEWKIMGRVANGSSNKEVGQEFSISERTVKHHLTNIFNKLGVSGRVALAVFALEHGLVSKG